jgi:hypothetical protein
MIRFLIAVSVALVTAAGPAFGQDDGEPTAEQIRNSVERGLRYLRTAQKPDGTWESGFVAGGNFPGGVTGVALLGLLSCGAKADDPAVARGLDVLRKVDSDRTYVLSLQALVYCRAGQPQDRERIQKCVDRLVDAIRREGGWGYFKDNNARPDNSNTRFAVAALHAADKAGAKVEERVWKAVREHYLRTQMKDGGWPYQPAGPISTPKSTLSMTAAGLYGLRAAQSRLKDEEEATAAALARGMRRLMELYPPPAPDAPDRLTARYYAFHAVGQLGALDGRRFLEEHPRGVRVHWYRDGAKRLLAEQQEDGSWKNTPMEISPVIATSFTLQFLTAAAK